MKLTWITDVHNFLEKDERGDSFLDAYELSLDVIKKETPIDLKLLPKECPYTFEQCVDDIFFPRGNCRADSL